METWSSIELWIWSLTVAGAGGWALLLKSEEPLNLRNITGSFLLHGLTGSAIGFVGFHYEYLWKGKQGVAFAVAQAYGVGVLTLAHLRPILLRTIGHGLLGGASVSKD